MANVSKVNRSSVEEATKIIKRRGLVVIPTDTLYAISTSALEKECIKKVYEVKGRGYNKPISIMFYSLSHAKKYILLNKTALRLSKEFLPGPLTIVLPMKHKFPKELTFGSMKVGIRVPDNTVALKIIKKCGFPLTATSANISGNKNPISAEDTINQVGDKVDLILDGGKCKYSGPSTVVEVLNDKIRILRKGIIPEKSLREAGN